MRFTHFSGHRFKPCLPAGRPIDGSIYVSQNTGRFQSGQMGRTVNPLLRLQWFESTPAHQKIRKIKSLLKGRDFFWWVWSNYHSRQYSPNICIITLTPHYYWLINIIIYINIMLVSNNPVNIEWKDGLSIAIDGGNYIVLDWKKLVVHLSMSIWSRIAMALKSEKSTWAMETHFRTESNCHGTTNEILFGRGGITSTPARPWALWDQIFWEKYADFYFRGKPKQAWFPPIIENMHKRTEITWSLPYPFWCASKNMEHSYVVLWEDESGREIIFEKKGYKAHCPFCLRKIWPKDRGMPYPFVIAKTD